MLNISFALSLDSIDCSTFPVHTYILTPVKPTTQFKKDYKLAMKRGLKIGLLEDVVAALAMGEPLPEKNKDHALSGNWVGHRECHILPDWLLVYRIEDDVLVDLFGK